MVYWMTAIYHTLKLSIKKKKGKKAKNHKQEQQAEQHLCIYGVRRLFFFSSCKALPSACPDN